MYLCKYFKDFYPVDSYNQMVSELVTLHKEDTLSIPMMCKLAKRYQATHNIERADATLINLENRYKQLIHDKGI